MTSNSLMDLSFLNIDFSIGRWDNQRLYKLYDFIIIGNRFNELSKKYSLCLATQSSIERLYSLVHVSHNWNGPISIGVYTAGEDEFLIFKLFVNYLRICYSSIRDNVSFHLAVPKDKIPNITSSSSPSSLPNDPLNNNLKFYNFITNNIKNNNENFNYQKQKHQSTNYYRNCLTTPENVLRRLLKLRTAEMIKWRQKHPYPQNHMRNIARKGCQTSNIFLTDVDIIPSINFTDNVDKFLKTHKCNHYPGSNNNNNNNNHNNKNNANKNKNNDADRNNNGGAGSVIKSSLLSSIVGGFRNSLNSNSNSNNLLNSTNGAGGGLCAYVVPTYEIDFRVKFPSNKSDLMRLVNKGLARPFHEKVFVYNQYATNFSRWQKDETSNIDTHISHNVTNFEFLYEPFYISSDNVPIHDERFLGYGFTRNSQVYEMYIAGYKFQVLSPVFTCHWGLQQKKTRPAWREQQNNVNRKHFERFKKEILARYNKENSPV